MTDFSHYDRPRSKGARLHVVHCIDNFEIGGTELNAIRTLERLDRDQFDLTLVALNEDGPLRCRYDRAGIRVHSFPLPNLYGIVAIRRAAALVSWMRRTRPDVVHCHDRYTNIFVTPLARLVGVPLTITSRRWWTAMPRRAHGLGNRWAYRMSHLVLANSPAVARLLCDSDGIDPRKIVVISNFVDDAAFEMLDRQERAAARQAFGIPEDAVVGVIVAMLRPVKDHLSLLRAAAQLAPRRPELHLFLVGIGPSESELRAAARELGIVDRVHFAGYLPSSPNPHQFAEFSVLCSLHEGFPNSIIEAMAAGNPVIATSVGGIPDAVENEVTGILVQPGAPKELAAAIDRLLGDVELRMRFGQAGRERAKARYRAEVVVGGLARLYLNGVEHPAG